MCPECRVQDWDETIDEFAVVCHPFGFMVEELPVEQSPTDSCMTVDPASEIHDTGSKNSRAFSSDFVLLPKSRVSRYRSLLQGRWWAKEIGPSRITVTREYQDDSFTFTSALPLADIHKQFPANSHLGETVMPTNDTTASPLSDPAEAESESGECQGIPITYVDQLSHVIIETCRTPRLLSDLVLLVNLHIDDTDFQREAIDQRVADLRDIGLLTVDDDARVSPTAHGRAYSDWLGRLDDPPVCRDPRLDTQR